MAAMPRGYLINMTDVEILRKYNSEISGLYNFYRLAVNVSTLNKFHHIMEYSMLKTFGMKYRTSVTELKKKYKKNGRFGQIMKQRQEGNVVILSRRLQTE